VPDGCLANATRANLSGRTIPYVAMPDQSRVIFLGGLGRSGSTLLERLLGQVEGMQTLGETVHVWARGVRDNERCGCGLPFNCCDFWRQVGEKAFGGWSTVDIAHVEELRARVDRLRHIPSAAMRPGADMGDYTDHYARLYAAAHEVSGARWLVDSSKHPSLAHLLRRRDDIDLRVVHVVRHPCAVAHSWTRVVQRPDVTTTSSDGDLMMRYSPSHSALLWNGENAAIEALRRLGVPVHRVRYEDLVDAPGQSLRDVLRFAGVSDDVAIPELGANAILAPSHTASGNPMRFDTGPITILRDDAWQLDLPSSDRRTVTALTWPLARAYGYTRAAHRAG
jgi:Sulfotransferase family